MNDRYKIRKYIKSLTDTGIEEMNDNYQSVTTLTEESF